MPLVGVISLDVDEDDVKGSTGASEHKREIELNLVKRGDKEIYQKFFTLVGKTQNENKGLCLLLLEKREKRTVKRATCGRTKRERNRNLQR